MAPFRPRSWSGDTNLVGVPGSVIVNVPRELAVGAGYSEGDEPVTNWLPRDELKKIIASANANQGRPFNVGGIIHEFHDPDAYNSCGTVRIGGIASFPRALVTMIGGKCNSMTPLKLAFMSLSTLKGFIDDSPGIDDRVLEHSFSDAEARNVFVAVLCAVASSTPPPNVEGKNIVDPATLGALSNVNQDDIVLFSNVAMGTYYHTREFHGEGHGAILGQPHVEIRHSQ